MLFEPVETPYDINFRAFGVDVRINPWFWLMTVVLGWPMMRLGLPYMVVWVLCVLFSILIHEFGHIFMGRLFGSDGYVVLYNFGGLAVGSNRLASWWQRILVSFAGPAAGFLFWGLLYIALKFRGDIQFNPLAAAAVIDLLEINLWWGILNLLPIWPLDGGQITYNLFTRLHPDRGAAVAYGLSFVCAALLAVNALMAANGKGFIPYASGGMYTALLFGYLAMGSFTALQRENNPWE